LPTIAKPRNVSGNFTEPTLKNENQMKKLIAGITIILCFLLVTFTSVLGNLFSILTENEYTIPKESSILTFEATKMNEGSGGWWLYGEDNKILRTINGFNKYDNQY